MSPRRRTGQGWSMTPALWARLKGIVREARHEPTPAEDLLWQKLRRKQLGVQFRRQHPINVCYADFCCPVADLVVELDGPMHEQQTERDAVRTEILEALGYQFFALRTSSCSAIQASSSPRFAMR